MADNDIAVVAAAWYLLEKNENANIERGKRPYKRRRERIYWNVLWGRDKNCMGEYHRLIQELRRDSDRFRRYFRTSTGQFDMLTDMIGPHQIAKLSTNWRQSISPAESAIKHLKYNIRIQRRLTKS